MLKQAKTGTGGTMRELTTPPPPTPEASQCLLKQRFSGLKAFLNTSKTLRKNFENIALTPYWVKDNTKAAHPTTH